MSKVQPLLEKQTTWMRKPISAGEYLAVTLRFLATGETYASLEYQFRISKSTLSIMVPHVCNLICQVLQNDYLSCPSTEDEWLWVSDQFCDKWQFPNCIGAGDGKHIRLRAPGHSGTEYFNYKGFYSLVLMAFVGPNYEFLFIDVGCQGSLSDGGIFRRTKLCEKLENNTLNIPGAKALPQNPDPIFEDTTYVKVDHYFVCDDAFSLDRHIMKPYAKRQLTDEQRIFNYRLSRARRISENAFGILAVRFRVLYSMLCIAPERATSVVLACCALHNMLLKKSAGTYAPTGTSDNDSEGHFVPGSSKERYSSNAKDMRDFLCNGAGSVP